MEYPEKIGPYRIEKRLGTGGMGTVYQAYDERLRRRVALKQVHPERATRPDARERFLSEVRAVARLNHPSLIHIYDILETSEGDWIVMELAEGPSLASLLAAGPLAPDLVVQLAQEIAGGLAAAHEAGILHRDLKTENVVLTRDGRAKILDFGLAAPIGDAEPDHAEIDAAEIDAAELAVSPGKLAGTPRAMSPEQALGKRGDARSDLFALGVLLYELATGSSPFLGPGPAETLARVCHEAHHPAQDHADLPRQLSELIDRLLEKQPDARPAGATEVVEALEPMVRAVGEGGGASTAVPLTAVPESFTEAPAPTKPAEDVQPFQLRGERRQLTLLCCQLVGGALDPEVLFEVLPPFQTVVNEAIERYEGHLRDVQGHRFVAIFGYPRSHEDNARRAVLAGLEIAARAATAAPGFELSAGVHTGPAVILSRGSGEHLALGETLDLAMALQEQAEPGKVWMSGATHSLVAGFFNDHEVDSAGGVAAFRVNAARDVHDRVEASESLTPFIGRQHELALLDSRWELASEGVGQAVMISGDVGIGKSRLLCELQARWSSADRRWLSAYGSPFARNLPLHPVGGLLRHLLEIDGSAATERQLVRLEAALAEHNLPPEETLSLFAALLGLPADDELDLYRLRREALEAVPALLQESAARHPLVLAFEDLHHADPTTLELIGRVIESVAASSALLVMTCRAGFRLPWGHRAQMTQLRLVPFDDAEVEALIDSLANEDRLAVDARKRLAERADGVPLFVEALVEQALDAEPSGAETVPETVRDLLEVQLDRVGAARDVARIAAGLGRQGRLADLAKAAALDKAALSQELERLREAGVLEVQGGRLWRFRQVLAREAGRSSLLAEDRELLRITS